MKTIQVKNNKDENWKWRVLKDALHNKVLVYSTDLPNKIEEYTIFKY